MPFDPVTWILARNAGASGASDAIEGLSEGMTFKGVVDTPNDLPSTHNDGDVWVVRDMNPSAPGLQGGKAVWYGSQWNYFDQIPSNVSELENDAQYISSKIANNKYVDNIHIDGNVTTPSTGAHEYIISEIQLERGTAASLANTVPKYGEPVFEKDGNSYRLKIGDGTTRYADLPYIGADFVPDVDNRSVAILGTNLQVYGFNTAPNGTIPRKVSGVLQWVNLNDVIKFAAGDALKLTETTSGGITTEKYDVLYDNSTVKLNTQNKLYVPIDNDTIKVTTGSLVAKKTTAGEGIKVETNTNNEYVISSNFKAGANINLEKKADGIYINSTASGGVGVVQAGDGIKVTSVGDRVTIAGDYQPGNYIHIDKNAAGKLVISVDQTAVTNTYRPILLNGVQVLGEEASTGHVDFESNENTPTGISMYGGVESGGAEIRMEIANTGIIQAAEVGTPHRHLATLAGRQIALHCGGADLSNALH